MPGVTMGTFTSGDLSGKRISWDARACFDLVEKESLPEATEVALANHPVSKVREALAARSSLSPRAQEVLAHDPQAGVRCTLAKNVGLYPSVQEVLSQDSEPLVHHYLALNPALVVSLQEQFSCRTSQGFLRDLVQNPSLVCSDALDARMVRDHLPEFYAARTSHLDQEMCTVLLSERKCSLAELLELVGCLGGDLVVSPPGVVAP